MGERVERTRRPRAQAAGTDAGARPRDPEPVRAAVRDRLGIYAFWVLLHNDSRALFEPGTQGAA